MIPFHDNACCYNCDTNTDGTRTGCSPTPSGFPALSDYHLFQSMQHALEDTHVHNYGEVESWVALNGLAQKTNRSFAAEFNFHQSKRNYMQSYRLYNKYNSLKLS